MRKRMGLMLILAGVGLALVAGLTLMGISNRAQKAAAQVKQVQVVMATQDIPQGTAITSAMLVLKPFPAEFAPVAAVTGSGEAVNKFTVTNVVKDQIITAPLLSTTKQAGKLALNIPKGKVAFALPKSDLLSANDAIQSGDHVDVLVTFRVDLMSRAGGNSQQEKRSTSQLTLQDIEVLDVLGGEGKGGAPAVVMLLDHQQAVTLTLAKNAESSVIDLALRGSDDDHQQVVTDGETEDSEMTKFKFRKPQPLR